MRRSPSTVEQGRCAQALWQALAMEKPVPSQPVRALLFDLGGVLIDFDFGRCFTSWANDAGTSADTYSGRFSFDAAYGEHERGRLNSGEYFAHLRQVLDLDLTDDQLLDGWNGIFIGPIAGVEALLVEAKAQVPLYAFTNTNPSHQSVWAPQFARELSVFDRVFVSSELGHRKPDRAAFELVVREIGERCGDIVFFDDSIENVEGARAVGMQAVHVTSPDSVRHALDALGLRSRR